MLSRGWIGIRRCGWRCPRAHPTHCPGSRTGTRCRRCAWNSASACPPDARRAAGSPGSGRDRGTRRAWPGSTLVPLLVGARLDEEFHLHLLELAGAEDEVSRRDLVAERLADLADAERDLLP